MPPPPLPPWQPLQPACMNSFWPCATMSALSSLYGFFSSPCFVALARSTGVMATAACACGAALSEEPLSWAQAAAATISTTTAPANTLFSTAISLSWLNTAGESAAGFLPGTGAGGGAGARHRVLQQLDDGLVVLVAGDGQRGLAAFVAHRGVGARDQQQLRQVRLVL